MSKKKNDAPVIAVINMKGGVSKTTISGNVFREVFRGFRRPCLLLTDFPTDDEMARIAETLRRRLALH